MANNEQDGLHASPSNADAASLSVPSRVGRPPTKPKNKVGRPKGHAAIQREYTDRMLNSPKSRKVLDKVFDIALDDDHRHQAVCIKLLVDRLVPMSHLEKEKGGGLSGITITMAAAGGDVNINTGGDTDIDNDITDADYEEV